MEEAAASEADGTAHYPPGTVAPKAADRIAALKEPDRLARLNAGKAAWYALPKEERQRITAERREAKRLRQAAREAKHATRNGHSHTVPPDTAADGSVDSAPPTVRSQRSSLVASPPESEIPRPGVRGGPLRGLLDLCEALPRLGDGTCFIQVTRVKPTMAFQIPCAGTQKPLWESVDDAEFAMIYGGAEYSLRGYVFREDGRPKALTEPVTYKVAGPPNLDSALTEEDAMRPQAAHVPNGGGQGPSQLRRPGLVTPHVATAEAEMYDRRLQHEETMDERNARRAEERRKRDEAREAEERRQQTDALRLVAEANRDAQEQVREVYEQRLAEKGGSMADIAELMKALKPDGDQNKELVRQHSAEIKQLTEASREQLSQLTQSHQAEVRRLTEMHAAALQRLDDQMRADRDRSDKLIRETDQRSNEQIREAERRADQRVTDAQNTARTTYEDLKTRSEERLRDQASAFTQRIEDMRDNHARELKRKDDELVLMRTGIEGNVAIVMSNKDSEIKRLERELRETKAVAEANKDWVGQMEKAEEQARALGYEKPEPGGSGEGDDLKTTAAKAGLNMLTQLPSIIESGANAIRQLRNPAAPPDPAQGQARVGARGHTRALPRSLGGAPPVILAPLPFATEDGGYTPPSEAQAPPPLQQRQTIAPIQIQQSPTQAIVQAAPEPQFAHQEPAPAPAPATQPTSAAPSPEQMAPAPAALAHNPAAVAPPAPADATDQDVDPMTLGIIQGLTPDLAMAFTQRVPPQDVLQRIVEANGIDGVRAALAMITIDQLIGAVGQDPRPEHAVLKTRNGVKFMREIWQAAEKLVSQ